MKVMKKELLVELEKAIKSKEVIDVLPLCRKYIDDFEPYMNQAIEWDLNCLLFHDGYFGLKAFGYWEDDNGIPRITGDTEYDIVIFKLEGNLGIPYNLIRMLAMILLSDCTGCCDALEFIKVSEYGILAKGDISQTYHS